MVDPGRWTIRRQADGVEFRHEVAAASGYAYEYRKVIRLGRTRPTLWLGHSLRNTGRRTIDTSHYNHNFFVIDERPSGPEFEVRFPFVPLLIEGPSDLLAVRGKALVYQQPLRPGSSVLARLGGFEASASDHVITVEGQGAGVQIRGDRPLCDMVFWSTPRTLCPEPYVAIAVAPGREMSWTSEYEFHSR
jgi:hypothetical protein